LANELDRSEEVDLEEETDIAGFGFVRGTIEPDPGVVDEDVDASEAVANGGGEFAEAVDLGEVKGKDGNLGVKAGGDGLEVALRACSEGQNGALGGEATGASGADSRGRSGDPNDFAAEVQRGLSIG